MKVRLEFEREDLEKMLTTYFEKEGFRVKNLEELIDKFGEAFPEGIAVQAEIIDTPPAPVVHIAPPGLDWGGQFVGATTAVGTPIPMVITNSPETPVVEEESPVYRDLEEEPLSMTDLLDPTKHRAGDLDENAQVLSLVEKSKQLERQLLAERGKV